MRGPRAGHVREPDAVADEHDRPRERLLPRAVPAPAVRQGDGRGVPDAGPADAPGRRHVRGRGARREPVGRAAAAHLDRAGAVQRTGHRPLRRPAERGRLPGRKLHLPGGDAAAPAREDAHRRHEPDVLHRQGGPDPCRRRPSARLQRDDRRAAGVGHPGGAVRQGGEEGAQAAVEGRRGDGPAGRAGVGRRRGGAERRARLVGRLPPVRWLWRARAARRDARPLCLPRRLVRLLQPLPELLDEQHHRRRAARRDDVVRRVPRLDRRRHRLPLRQQGRRRGVWRARLLRAARGAGGEAPRGQARLLRHVCLFRRCAPRPSPKTED